MDDRKWVINGKSSERYNGLLHAINQDNPGAIQSAAAYIPKLAMGGRTGNAMLAREFSSGSAGMRAEMTQFRAAMSDMRKIELNQTIPKPVRQSDAHEAQRISEQISEWGSA